MLKPVDGSSKQQCVADNATKSYVHHFSGGTFCCEEEIVHESTREVGICECAWTYRAAVTSQLQLNGFRRYERPFLALRLPNLTQKYRCVPLTCAVLQPDSQGPAD
jgi:hypothetical protein